MDWLTILTLIAMLSGLALAAETFRSRPMWRYIDRERPGPSPRQRRVMGLGLALAMTGQLLSLQLEGDTPLWTLSFALTGAGFICMVASAFLGPTDAEQQRRADALSANGPDTN